MKKNTNQGIYKITNTKTGKIYIGSTINLHKRHKQHFIDLEGGYHGNSHLQNSYNKYGKESFVFEVVEECAGMTMGSLRDREQYYLDSISDWSSCYNVAKIVGFYQPLPPVTDETRAKMSARRGELHPLYGRKVSEEFKQNIREFRRVSGAGIKQTKNGDWKVSISIPEFKDKHLGTYQEESDAIKVRYLAEQVYWHNDVTLLPELEKLQLKTNRKGGVRKTGSNVRCTPKGRYIAIILVNNKSIHLGTFDTEQEALAIKLKAEKYYYEGDDSLKNLFVNIEKSKKRNPYPVGVNLVKGGKFRAVIVRKGVKTNLGVFDTPELAHAARLAAEQALLS
jgi:group I intron endonuclease